MTVIRHAIDVEPEVRALVDSLDEFQDYAITRDLVPHVLARRGGAGLPVVFYDAATGREAGLAFGDHIRVTTADVPHLRAAVRDRQAVGATADTIGSLNGAARDARIVAAMIAAQAVVDQARGRRDDLVRQVAATGVTAYRIHKMLGVAESTVGRILARDR